jgi:hypothetical protein
MGSGISSLVGMRNTPETARKIQLRVDNALLSSSLLRAEEYKVDVFPFSENVLVVVVVIKPIGLSTAFVLNYSYDLRYDHIVPRSI